MNLNIVALLLILSMTIALPMIFYTTYAPLTHMQWECLKICLYISQVSALICWVFGELTSNVSQVDKIWSIIPCVYVWTVAYMCHFPVRMVLMCLLVTSWGCRLTYNFSRMGGYSWRFWEGTEGTEAISATFLILF